MPQTAKPQTAAPARSQRTLGILCTIAAAVLYGFTHVLASLANSGGAGGITVTFLRSVLTLPVLLFLIWRRGSSLRLSKTQVWQVLLLGGLGSCATTLLLYISYNYVDVGLATTLHFLFPMWVTLGCFFFFKERLTAKKIIALVAGTAGVFLFLEKTTAAGGMGMLLAALSSVTYAFYVIFLAKSQLKDTDPFVLAFYLCLCMAFISGIFGGLTGGLHFNITPLAWLCAFGVSLGVSVGAAPLFQLGVRYTGPTTAAILSTFEPITSILFGFVLLGERLNALKLLGCVFILAAVVLISLPEKPAKAKAIKD